MMDEPSFDWIKQLRDVAYAVDDVVDEFQLKAEKYDARSDGSIVSKYMCTKPRSFIFECKAASKIKSIKKRFSAIVKQRTNFNAIANSLPDGHPAHHRKKTTAEMPTSPILDAASVLGREQEKHQIISKLVETNEQQKINIISIIGLGGSGKTTLAKLVFNDADIIERPFEVRLWIHVSQEFDVHKLVEKLFEAFADDRSDRHPLQHMINKISEKLTGKRFLLVLDDVWTESRIQWEEFMIYLKSSTSGSSILLTTRSRVVAKAVESTVLFDLPFLHPDNSWQLFHQSFGGMEGLGSEFQDVGKEIVNKCGGVPLAIKVFAGVLSDKKRIEEWQAMRDNNLLDVEGEEHRVAACLRLSYFHLPCHLKQCFSICSLFPKGHKINKQKLIDQWIAHDMIKMEVGVDYSEHLGDKYFNSLVQMSFLQDVDESNGGVTCKMHDLIHDLARSILGDEILLAWPKEETHSTKSYRYFSLIKQSGNLPPKNLVKKARAMYIDEGNDFIYGKALKSAKHLRSITVESTCTKTVLSTILQIKNLRYLNISVQNCEKLPDSISNIWSLQALHVTCSNLLELPNSIGKLQKLRTLSLRQCRQLKCLPDSIGDCNMISIIDLYGCYEVIALPDSISRNKNLRVLRLGGTKIERLPPGITTAANLKCLDLHHCQKLVELPEGIGNLRKLEVLMLERCNKLGSMPKGIGHLSRLEKLALFIVGEGENSAHISELGNLARTSQELTIRCISRVMNPDDAHRASLKQKTKLQKLNLYFGRNDRVNIEKEQAVLDGLEPPSRIEVLEIDGYAGGCYTQWMLKCVGGEVQSTSQFAYLTRMRLSDFSNVKHLEGLVELPCLRELELERMHALESISGGPFPSLVKLQIGAMPSLGEIWMVTEETLVDGKEGGCCSIHTDHMGKMQIGNNLAFLWITSCPKLKIMPYLPSSLKMLWLWRSSEMLLLSPGQGQGPSCFSCDTGLPESFSFSNMKYLSLRNVTTSSLSSSPGPGCGWELLHHLTSLESLEINYCDGLIGLPESMRSLTSLQRLIIRHCSALSALPEWLGELRSLQNISVKRCSSLSCLSSSMQRLTALHTLDINVCSTPQVPEWLGDLRSLQAMRIRNWPHISSLPESLQHLTSLQKLEICWCDALQKLPESIGELRSLRTLQISDLPGLTCLPESMGHLASLEELDISRCPGLTSLPEWIQGLTALRRLWISEFPDPERHCERGEGKDWHLISHIPDVWIR